MAEYPDRDPGFNPGSGTTPYPHATDRDEPDRLPRSSNLDGREATNASDPTSPQSLVTLAYLQAHAGSGNGGPDTYGFDWEDVGTSLPAAGGINFDTAPQIGEWLSIRTTGTAPDTVQYTNGYSIGMWAHDDGTNYPGGIDLLSDRPNNTPNEFQVGATNSYDCGIALFAHEGLQIFNSSGGRFYIRQDSDEDLLIEARSGSGIRIDSIEGETLLYGRNGVSIGANYGEVVLTNFGGTGDRYLGVAPNGALKEMGTASGGGGGINFDTSPQTGNWLYLTTTNGATAPNDWGVELMDTGGYGVHLMALAGGDIQLDAAHQFTVRVPAQGTTHSALTMRYDGDVNLSGYLGITLRATGIPGNITLQASDAPTSYGSGGGRVDIIAGSRGPLFFRGYGGVTMESLGPTPGLPTDQQLWISSSQSIVFNMWTAQNTDTQSFKIKRDNGYKLFEIDTSGVCTINGQPLKIAAQSWVQMTQVAYNALGTKDPNTLYVIVG